MRYEALIRVEPDAAEIGLRASRARRGALARLDRGDAPPRRSLWRPVFAAALLSIAAAAMLSRAPDHGPAVSSEAPAREPLRVHMVLSDGTRVQWTFLEDSRL